MTYVRWWVCTRLVANSRPCNRSITDAHIQPTRTRIDSQSQAARSSKRLGFRREGRSKCTVSDGVVARPPPHNTACCVIVFVGWRK